MYARPRKYKDRYATPFGTHIGIGGRYLRRHCSLEDILKCEDPDSSGYTMSELRECENVLIQVNVFGTNRLYKLVDAKKLRDYRNLVKDSINLETGYANYDGNKFCGIEDPTEVSTFFWGMMSKDTVPARNINFKTRLVNNRRAFTPAQALEFYIQKGIVDGMNEMYRENGIDTQLYIGFSTYHFDADAEITDECGYRTDNPDDKAFFGHSMAEASAVLEGEIPFNDVIPNFNPEGYEPGKYKYILDLPYSRNVRFANNVLSDEFHRIFVHIPEFDLWQELDRNEVAKLQALNTGKIIYSRVDDPHCFSKVAYGTQFDMDSIEDILYAAVAIPMDIRWHQAFDWQKPNNSKMDRYGDIPPEGDDPTLRPLNFVEYEALSFEFDCYQYFLKMTLSQEELGIGNNNSVKQRETEMSECPEVGYYRGADFWMLGLIIQILGLRPTLGDTFSEGDYDARY